MTLSDEPAGNPAENPDGNSVDVAANLALVQASIAAAAKAAVAGTSFACLITSSSRRSMCSRRFEMDSKSWQVLRRKRYLCGFS